MFAHFQSAFVRQKTPHPKELKAKAHKLFGNKREKSPSSPQNQENGTTENFTFLAEPAPGQFVQETTEDNEESEEVTITPLLICLCTWGKHYICIYAIRGFQC